MAYIGEIGKRIKVTATFKKSFEYVDHKFSYYGTTHYIHSFEDSEGNVIVWKTTAMIDYFEGDKCIIVSEGSTVELTGTVKEHGMYKDSEQTILSRCKVKLIERAKTKCEIEQEQAEAQMASIAEGDYVWEMPYRQFKEHYSDCETIIGSFDRHEDRRGIPQGEPTIKVIIRAGRLKKSGVRGEHYKGFEFTTDEGKKVAYRAISEETARKRMKKDYPESDNWECTRIYNYQNTHRIY